MLQIHIRIKQKTTMTVKCFLKTYHLGNSSKELIRTPENVKPVPNKTNADFETLF
jgi:hypothetical protein